MPATATISPHYLDRHSFAKRLNVSEKSLDTYRAAGRIPKPHKFGRNVRWLASDIEAWEAAGCPSADEWEQIKSNGNCTSGH